MSAPHSLPQASGEVSRGRYPGAQPFLDDQVSRKVFFGRRREQESLANQVMAQRLVVVYARSGFGKTSLLQAGIADELRREGFAPLFTRVNDTSRGPVGSVLDDVAAEARRQHLEFVPGDPRTLWWFFKTAQFWRDDQLLVPVLVCDQFEEIFTLNGASERDAFLSQLGELTRGVRFRDLCAGSPSFSNDAPPDVSDSAPLVHVVLGIREDYLGFLEEASDRIPDILHQRFRVVALGRTDALEAIAGPAALNDEAFAVPAFAFEPAAMEKILDFLAVRRSTAGEPGALGLASAPSPATDQRIEPFQLQLICQTAEEIVQRQSSHPIAGHRDGRRITFEDLGGERGLRAILRTFYIRQIRKLPAWRVRRRARYLCADVLISKTGRRLSVDQGELERKTRLTRDQLDVLVNARLLRVDQRADSSYFELSHDSLVQPIRSSRLVRRSASALGNGVKALVALLLGVVASVYSFVALMQLGGLTGVAVLVILATCGALLLRVAWRSASRTRDVIRR